MKVEPTLNLAISMHANPGVYALLLGSGVSRSAGILTGWEIVLDLVRRVAKLRGKDPEPDPEKWFVTEFGEPPDYTKLLDALGKTATERCRLLREYFVPTEEGSERGEKSPTEAHRAVARLVKLGHVRMILTTNFDRLVEMALEEESVVPDVISSEDALKGAVPYVHSDCTLVKLHGDYRDTRIRNTPEELSRYTPTWDAFLDRILDEFGLVICGWSGAWDTALRQAILRCPNRRFTTFWLAKGQLTEEAKTIIRHRHAEVVSIESADQFFIQFREKLESFHERERAHPMSTAVAVATAKRYVAERRHRVRLHDLILEEVKAVRGGAESELFAADMSGSKITKQVYQERLHLYEELSARLRSVLAAVAYHAETGYARLLTRSVELLMPAPLQGMLDSPLTRLRLYPGLLSLYAAGLAALAGARFRALAAVLLHPAYRSSAGLKTTCVSKLNARSVLHVRHRVWVPTPDADPEGTPENNHLLNVLRADLEEYLPDGAEYDQIFDVFEYILGLTYMDAVDEKWSPPGRFAEPYRLLNTWDSSRWSCSAHVQFVREGLELGPDWGLLKVGFFGSSVEKLERLMEKHQALVQKWAKDGWEQVYP